MFCLYRQPRVKVPWELRIFEAETQTLPSPMVRILADSGYYLPQQYQWGMLGSPWPVTSQLETIPPSAHFSDSPVFNPVMMSPMSIVTGSSAQSLEQDQIMQQATAPGISEDLKLSLFRYAKCLAGERLRK